MLFENVAPTKDWAIEQKDFAIENNRHYEALFTIGSGYINIRASLEEGLSDDPQNYSFDRMVGNVTLEKFEVQKSKWGTYIPGFMDQHPTLNEEMVNIPFPLGIHIYADNEKLDPESSIITANQRWLNMQDGTLHRKISWQTAGGAEIAIQFDTFVDFTRPQLIFQQLSIKTTKGKVLIRVEPFLDGDVRTNGFDHTREILVTEDHQDQIGICSTLKNGNLVVLKSKLSGLDNWLCSSHSKSIKLSSSKQMTEGQEIVITKLTAVATNLDDENPAQMVDDILEEVATITFEDLYEEHRLAWQNIWQNSDIKIEGDENTQQTLRFSIFHLVRSNPRNPRAAIDAKMNGGDAYWGRIHWDNEIFIAPFFIYALPEMAKPLLQYRLNTLAGAKERAKSLGYQGAMFAWESGSKGTEQCPSFQYADHEIHITADVTIGLWHYFCATNDIDFLTNVASEVIFETAKFWRDRISWDENGQAHLLCVMGPDEYCHAATDNAFTNYLAGMTLSIACLIYDSAIRDNSLEDLLIKMGITAEEVEGWRQASESIYIPYDEERNLFLQSADFEQQEEIDFDKYWQDRTKPFGQFVSQERLYRSKALKQADVLMMMQLFITDFDISSIEVAYKYYEKYTTHDSSLSVSTHSIIAARLGWAEKAWDYFKKALVIDLGAGSHNSAEGVHSANAGAIWQGVVFGFLGLLPAYLSETPTLDPKLPKHWTSCALSINWQGTLIKLKVSQAATIVCPDTDIQVSVYNQVKDCEAQQETTFLRSN